MSKKLTSEQVRQRFLDFWTSAPRNAKIVPNASLIPNNDPTLLFVNSGMFPLVPYLGGTPHPLGKRLCNVQRCIRTIDIDEVGDYNHLILFEMIGNWSLGDFKKRDQIMWKMELYVEQFGLDPQRIFATVWGGNDEIPKDDEAIEVWIEAFKKYGIDAKFSENINDVPQIGESSGNWEVRILPYGKSDNWWQRGPDTAGELGGPSSEIFYDMQSELADTGEKLHINDDSGRYLEIGNSVFMEYKFGEDGKWHLMEQRNIDYGGGLDRIVAVAQGKRSIYETDLFEDYIKKIEELSGKTYDPENGDESETRAFRIVAEHARSTTFLLGDEVKPGNKDQAYILRRLIRRMVRFGMKLGIQKDFTKELAMMVIEKMEGAYPHLRERQDFIIDEIDAEEIKFRKTIEVGLKEMQKMIETKEDLDGKKAFYIYETFGFPLELTLEEFDLSEERISKITEEFEKEKEEHAKASRAGSEQKFKGGLADHTRETMKLHTAHHLLLRALQEVLGEDVHQRGSNITGERLRIDFNYDSKLSDEQVEKVEKLVNEMIDKGIPVTRVEMPREEAQKIGAEMEFGQKYPDIVSVYYIGDDIEHAFSKEFCGGPHVLNTSELAEGGKKFKIAKQESSGAGIRRIKGVLV